MSILLKNYKPYLLLILLTLVLFGKAQNIETRFNTLVGTKERLPFWLWANQLGKFDQNNTVIQNFEVVGDYGSSIKESDISFQSHACINLNLGNQNSLFITELYGGLNWKFLQLKVGAFAEKELYNGLSASNGNLAYSQNARPHPRLRIGTNRFVPLIFNWLSFYGIFEEGILNDNRYVDNTHLHHKSVYIKVGISTTFQISTGIEHYVMWWGTHPTFGELPGWGNYFRYITGSAGGNNAIITEQVNAVGNSYGTYQLEGRKRWEKIEACLYLSHPFDDRSGIEWENWRDNLWGVHIKFTKKTKLLQSFLVEYYYTKHQSGTSHLELQPDGNQSGRGRDDYFNHKYYLSGVTYHQNAMGSPLFSPVIIDNGKSIGFENNRISGFHFGGDGYFCNNIQWKSMLTITQNFGIYEWAGKTSYTPKRSHIAGLLQTKFRLNNIPLAFATSFAFDNGVLFNNGNSSTHLGGMLTIIWQMVSY